MWNPWSQTGKKQGKGLTHQGLSAGLARCLSFTSVRLDLFLHLSVCLASARLVLLELKKKKKEWSQKISSFHKISGFTASWWGVRTCWQGCVELFAPGSLHITIVMATEEGLRHQRPRRSTIALAMLWTCPLQTSDVVHTLSLRGTVFKKWWDHKAFSVMNVKIWRGQSLLVCSACLPPQAEAISALLIFLTGLWLELPLFPTCSLTTWDCKSLTASPLWANVGEAVNNKGCNLKATPAFPSHQLEIVFFRF